MEGRLSKPLAEKIATIDLSHPYIWKLRLSEADFNEIEVCLKTIVTTQGVSPPSFILPNGINESIRAVIK